MSHLKGANDMKVKDLMIQTLLTVAVVVAINKVGALKSLRA